MFISREFQKTATVALAFSNVRGSHSSVVQNNNDEKCLLVNRESDLIIWITTAASIWETSQKIPSRSRSQLWVFVILLRGTIKSAKLQERSPGSSALVAADTTVSHLLRTSIKGRNLFWSKLESKNIETKPEISSEHYWGKALFNIIESRVHASS